MPRIVQHAARVWMAAACSLLGAGSAVAAASTDTGAGARIATAGVASAVPACASCHGAHGEGSAAFPHLAGTGVDYLREQLESFASGTRKNPVMQPIAQALSPQQRDQVAAYYASLRGLTVAADKEPRSPSDLGPWLATRGRWSDGLPACSQCHGPGGQGVGTRFPPLAGQSAAYIAAQLKAWKTGDRPPGPLSLMHSIARKLNDADVKAVSDYYSALASASAAAAPASKPAKVAP